MNHKPYNVLFLCTHNSARSILAESLLNALGQGRFIGHSAGSSPSGKVNPFALAALDELGHDTTGLHSKHWHEYAVPDAPPMDFIFTVCDNAAGETCPIWPGHPMTAHWGFADPSRVEGDDAVKRAAFMHTVQLIRDRLQQFISLVDESGAQPDLLPRLRALGT